ncbi:hypothetical protein C9890_0071, partial [Perkinsus sp. BL_2016]
VVLPARSIVVLDQATPANLCSVVVDFTAGATQSYLIARVKEPVGRLTCIETPGCSIRQPGTQKKVDVPAVRGVHVRNDAQHFRSNGAQLWQAGAPPVRQARHKHVMDVLKDVAQHLAGEVSEVIAGRAAGVIQALLLEGSHVQPQGLHKARSIGVAGARIGPRHHLSGGHHGGRGAAVPAHGVGLQPGVGLWASASPPRLQSYIEHGLGHVNGLGRDANAHKAGALVAVIVGGGDVGGQGAINAAPTPKNNQGVPNPAARARMRRGRVCE